MRVSVLFFFPPAVCFIALLRDDVFKVSQQMQQGPELPYSFQLKRSRFHPRTISRPLWSAAFDTHAWECGHKTLIDSRSWFYEQQSEYMKQEANLMCFNAEARQKWQSTKVCDSSEEKVKGGGKSSQSSRFATLLCICGC